MNSIGKFLRPLALAAVMVLALSDAMAAQTHLPAPPACSNGKTCCCNGINCGSTPCEGPDCCLNCPCSGPFCPPASTEPISVSVDDASVNEGSGSPLSPPKLEFDIRRGRIGREMAVVVQTNPGSTHPASENSDYAPLACTAIFPLGDANSSTIGQIVVPVSVFNDTQPEPDETLFLHLTRAIELVTPQFTQTSHAAGGGPNDLKIGDFNDDGKPDLVVANHESNDVSVLLGNGDGTYAAAVHYPAGPCADSVVIGDLNNDGKQDLAVAASCDNFVAVLLGKGDGTFYAAVRYFVSTAQELLLRDFNGDGKPDLMARDRNNNSEILVLFNDGSGRFDGFPRTVAGGFSGFPEGFGVADFNGDGRLDIAVSVSSVPIPGSTNELSVMLARADGGFEAAVDYPAASAGDSPGFVATGDLNGDGAPDIVVGIRSTHRVAVFLNNGNGGFASAVNYATGSADTQGLAIGDINGDGRPDIAVANQNGDNVSVLINRGGGVFADAVNIPAGDGAIAVAIGDLDGNGAADLAVANRAGSTASVLLAPAPILVAISDNEGLGTIVNDDGAPPPTVLSITRTGASPTTATSVSWTVTFSEAVTGVDVSDFDFLSTGLTGALEVSGSGATYTVTLNDFESGSVQLDLQDDDSIAAVDDGQKLGGAGGGRFKGEAYVSNRDAEPDSFTFTSVTGVTRGSTQTAMTTITGINVPVPVTVEDGSYSVGCTGVFITAEGSISSGQTVCIRHTAASQFNATVTSTLQVGRGGVNNERQASFSSTTEATPTGASGTTNVPVQDSGGGTYSFSTSDGTIMILRAIATPDEAAAMSGVSFPSGFFAFDIVLPTGVTTAMISIALPAGVSANALVKCNADGVCRQLTGVGITTVAGITTLSYTLVDNSADDSDPRVGFISDPIGPAVVASGGNGEDDGFLGLGGLDFNLLLSLLVVFGYRNRPRRIALF